MKNLLIKLVMSAGLVTGLSVGGATVATAASAASSTPPVSCYPSCTTSASTVPTSPLQDQQPAVTVNDGVTPAAAPPDGPAAAQSGQALAFTGSDVIGTVTIGAVLIGAGFLLTRLSRRRRHAA